MVEIFNIDYPKNPAEKKKWNKRFGMNAYYSGKPWQLRRQDAEFWHLITRSAMNAYHVRRRPFESPVIITFYWNDRLDLDNHAIMGKMIVDAMRGRVIQDDSRQFVKGVCHYWHDGDHIKIVITEV